MCAPMTMKTEEKMFQGVLKYAREFKQLEKKSSQQIAEEMTQFEKTPMKTLKDLRAFVQDVRNCIDMIYAPTFVIQARHDQVIDPNSANIIFNEIESNEKNLKWYEESGHVITLDKEKDQLHEDVYQFLEGLDWSV